MAISTNQKPTIYRNLYENTAPGTQQAGDANPMLVSAGPSSATLDQH